MSSCGMSSLTPADGHCDGGRMQLELLAAYAVGGGDGADCRH